MKKIVSVLLFAALILCACARRGKRARHFRQPVFRRQGSVESAFLRRIRKRLRRSALCRRRAQRRGMGEFCGQLFHAGFRHRAARNIRGLLAKFQLESGRTRFRAEQRFRGNADFCAPTTGRPSPGTNTPLGARPAAAMNPVIMSSGTRNMWPVRRSSSRTEQNWRPRAVQTVRGRFHCKEAQSDLVSARL